MSISDFISHNSSLHIGNDKESDIKSLADKIISTGIKVKDAYHISCAIYARCDYFFTTDYRLLRYDTSEIKICNPIEFFNSAEEKEPKFDYTEWQRRKFDNMTSDEFNKAAVEYETQHPFVMKMKP